MTSRLSPSRLASTFLSALLVGLGAGPAVAQTNATWDGGGSNNLWSTGANWVGDAAPAPSNSLFLTFSGSTRTSPFNDRADWANVAGITFASGASGFRIEGNAIGFVNGGGQQVINQNAAATQEINAVFSFGSNQDSRINLNAGDLLISAANTYIDSSSSAIRSLTIAGSDSTRRTVTYTGNLNKSFSGNDPDMYIQNNKRVLASGSLTFGSGNDAAIFIDDGVLQFSGAGTMTGGAPAVGNTSGSANAALLLDTAGATFARQIELRGGSSGQRIVGGVNTSGTVTFLGNMVATNSPSDYDLKAASGGAANFSGSRNFNAVLRVNRADADGTYGGTVILSGTTSSNSRTALHAGTLQFGDFNQLGTDSFEFDAASGDSGTLRYTGGSTTTTKTLWVDNTGITRAAIDVSLAGTTLTWNPGGGARTTNLTKTGAGWLFFGGGISGGSVGVEGGLLVLSASNSYAGGTTVTAGTLEVSAGGAEGGSAAGLGTGPVSIGSGGQVTYWLSQSASNTVTNVFSLSGGTLYTQDGANTYSGLVTLASGSSTIAAKYEDVVQFTGGLAGPGNVLFTQVGGTGAWAAPTYVLSGTGSNTGTVRVTGSSGGGATTLRLANVNALQGATLDMATGDAGTVEFYVTGFNTYALGGLQGSRNLAFGGNSLSVGGNNQNTTYSGSLSGSGAFAKVGSGTLTLSGNNTNSGGMAVNAGVLALGSAGAVGSSGTISFGGGTLQYSAGNTTDYSGRFSTTAGQQYRIDTNGQSVSLASNLTSVGGTLTKLGSGTLTLGGANSYGGGTTVAAGRLVGTTASLQGAITNDAAVTFDQAASGTYAGAMTGSGSLTKLGSGTVTLSGANTYSGGSTISAGRLVGTTTSLRGAITNDAAVTFDQATSGTYAGVMAGSGSLTKLGSGTVTLTGNNSYAGGTIVSAGRLVGTTTSLQGAITNDAAVTFDQVASGTYAGVMAGSGSLTKLGGGTLTLTGSNAYTGGTVVSAGRLVGTPVSVLGDIVNDAAVEFVVPSDTMTYSGLMSGSGTLIKSGAGGLSLNNVNSYSGGTIVEAGQLILGADSLQGAIANAAIVTFQGESDGTYAGVISGTGAVKVHLDGGSLTFTGSNTYSGGTIVEAGVLIGTTASLQGAITNDGVVVFDQEANGTYAGVMAGTGSLAKNGNGTVMLTGSNSYGGGSALNAGTLALGSADALGTAGPISFGGGTLRFSAANTTDYSSRFSADPGQQYRVDTNGQSVSLGSDLASAGGSLTKLGSGTLAIAGNNTYDGGTAIDAGVVALGSSGALGTAGPISFGGGTLRFSSANTTDYSARFSSAAGQQYRIDTNGQSVLLGSNLASSGGSLVKLGSGTLTMSGNNTYDGGTAIDAGVLALGSAGALGSSGTISFGGGTLRFSAANTTDYSSRFSTAANQSFRFDTNGESVTLASNLQSAGASSLTKLGSGTLTLSGTNFMYGTVAINAGSLAVASIGAFQTASQIAFNGGTLRYATSDFTDYSALFSNAAGQQYRVDTNGYSVFYMSPLTSSGGSLTKVGAGTLQLLGTNSYDGGTTVSGGTLFGNTSSVRGDIVNNAQVYFFTSSTGTYAGTMSGTGGLRLDSSASLVLAGTNTYSGGTLVNSGRLVGTTTGVQGAIENYGVVEFAQAAAGTYAAVMSGTGRLEKSGAGNLVVTATNTYTGATTVAAGRLSVNGRLGNTAVTVQTGAEIGGSGRIAGSMLVAAGGTLAPGNSIESLGVGATTFSGSSTFAYEYDSSASLAVGGDLLAVSGNLSIASGALVTFADIAGSPQTFALGTSLAMINYSGTWDGGYFTYGATELTDGATFTVGSQQWQIDYNRTSAAGLLNYTADYQPSSSFVAITAVPEPSTYCMALAGLACGGFAMWRRRTRRPRGRSLAIAAVLALCQLALPRASDAGTLYVADRINNVVAAYDGTTGAVINSSFITGLNNPWFMTRDSDGNFYVTNRNSNAVGKYAPDGTVINASFIAASDPMGVAVDNAGRLFLSVGSSVRTYNASTGALINSSFISGLSSPRPLALDGAGNLFVGDYFGSTVGKYDAATGAAVNASLITGFPTPLGLAFDATGKLFVSSLGNPGVQSFDASTGSAISGVRLGGFGGTFGLAFDESNNFFVSRYSDGFVAKLTATGSTVTNPLITLSANGPTSLVYVGAVPEPSTYVMALAGLAGGGWVVRRRGTRT